MRYNPALDGLRALAVLAVVAMHCHLPGFEGGFLGVDMFFALSGYLITSLLLAEHDRTATIDLRAFYVRRLRRLYPALLFMLAVYLCVAPRLWPDTDHVKGAIAGALYLTDYLVPYAPTKYIPHLWSLSVEMHFYLLWPVLLLLALRRWPRQSLPTRLLWFAGAATAWSALYEVYGGGSYDHMDTRVFELAWGAWFASVVMVKPDWFSWRLAKPLGIAGLVVLADLTWMGLDGPARMLVSAPLTSLATVAVIYGIEHLPLRHPALVRIGVLSYGIYLWHFPVMMAVDTATHPHASLRFVLTLTASTLLAALSYYTVEALARKRPMSRITTTYIPDSCPPAP